MFAPKASQAVWTAPSRFLRASIRGVTNRPTTRAVTTAVTAATRRVHRVLGMRYMLPCRACPDD
jgi:hypothetical protein